MNATRGVLFVDVSESTELYREHGDETGDRLVCGCLDILRRVVDACDGEVNAQIGDELLCLFTEAGATARAAVELQRAVRAAKFDGRLPDDLNVRVGLHHGSSR